MSSVLVVDDSRFDREYITRILKARGYDVVEARDGPDGLELARSRKPELILTSSVLSSMDGYEFVRRLRCERPPIQTPVLFSARAKDKDLAWALARSCDVPFVLGKRSHPADIVKSIESALGPVATGSDAPDLRAEASARSISAPTPIRRPEILMQYVCDLARRLAEATGACLELLDEDERSVQSRFSSECIDLPVGAAAAAESAQASNTQSSRATAALPSSGASFKTKVASSRRLYGWLSLSGLKEIDSEDKRMLSALASMAALCCENKVGSDSDCLSERAEELEAQNRDLAAFAHSVAHDLRSPLQAIIGFSDILMSDHADKLDNSGKECLAQISAASRRMNQLIGDLLEVSQGVARVRPTENVDLTRLARAVATDLRLRDSNRSVEFMIHEGLSAAGHSGLLRQVLDNLFDNALKFTRYQIEPRIEFGSVGLSGGKEVFFVRDNGAGFDMSQGNRMFDDFERLHCKAKFQGTGIGLATVRRIIQRHGGRVWAEGEVGCGATFYFTL